MRVHPVIFFSLLLAGFGWVPVLLITVIAIRAGHNSFVLPRVCATGIRVAPIPKGPKGKAVYR